MSTPRPFAIALLAALVGLAACSSESRPVTKPGEVPRSHISSPPSPTPTPTSSPKRLGNVTISAVGDTMLGDSPQVPSDPLGYMQDIGPALRDDADIVFGNLEGTLTEATNAKCGAGYIGCYDFKNPPSFAHALKAIGFDVLNSANNHSHDFGPNGMVDTTRALKAAGIRQTGLPGEITVLKAHRVRVAFVGFAPYDWCPNMLNLPAAAALISRATRRADVVVAYMHAGSEGVAATHVTGHEEYSGDEDRGNARVFAHQLVDAGADLVLGSGPHVVRGMEFYRGRLIAYSLGNFVNFHNFNPEGILGNSSILHVTVAPSGRFVRGRVVPVHLDGEGHATVGGATVAAMATLSQQDFGAAGARFTPSGRISAPR